MLRFQRLFFKEFVVHLGGQPETRLERLREAGYLAGLPLGRWYPELADCLLIAVTEKRTRPEIDGLAEAFHAIQAKQRLRPHIRSARAKA